MKKILQISNYYYPHVGGIESTCQYLSEGLIDEYEVRVVCFSEDKRNKKEIVNGVNVFKAGVFSTIARQGLSMSYYKILKEQMLWEPDIVHFHYPNPFVTAILMTMLPQKCKLYVHWHLDITKQKKIYPFIKPLETKLLRRADMIVTTSPIYRDSSKPLNPFIHKTEILPSGINLSDYNLDDDDLQRISEIKYNARGKKIVLYVGRHVPHKGVGVLIDAESLINNNCVIYIVGSGPITEEVKEKCRSKRVFFLGRLPDLELKRYYYAADIFAFPSYTKAEAFGLTLVEAMYCGAVPVTFNIPGSGVNWVSLKDVTGLEVPNLDIQSFANAINSLSENDELRCKLSYNAKQRVIENFSVEKEVELLKDQYKKILEI